MGSTFDASASFQGYNYQLRLALILAVKRARLDPAHNLSLELLDDVALAGSADIELVQAKHTNTVLTDASSEFWKSIRIWAEGIRSGVISAADSVLALITTGSVSTESVLRHLQATDRNVPEALRVLEGVAEASQNSDLTLAFEAFLALTRRQRTALLAAIIILPQQSDAVRLRADLEAELRFATTKERLQLLVDRLEGWWFNQAVQHLAPSSRKPIPLYLFDLQIDRLRDEYSEQNLPIEFEGVTPAQETVKSFYNRLFVQQLRLIGFNKQLTHAIHDYYRAVEQRSKWVKDSLLYLDDLTRYETRLKDAWQRSFDSMLDELGSDASEDLKVKLGRELVKWMEQADLRVVRDCDAPFVMRGSFHALADRQVVGWHADFLTRLQSLLAEVAT